MTAAPEGTPPDGARPTKPPAAQDDGAVQPAPSIGRRLAWFALLWGGGVGCVAVAAYLLRWVIGA